MEEKLDFSLPHKKNKSPLAPKLSIVLLLVLIALTLAGLVRKSSNKGVVTTHTGAALSMEQVKELASKLAQRSLYTRAAQVWQEYLAGVKLSEKEYAGAFFQIGTLFEKAGMPAEAIEYFYRSEMSAKLPELEQKINIHIKDCFEKLGKFSALRYELMDRTNFKNDGKAGGTIVAEIGPEKVTEADLDALIEQAIDNQLAPLASFMTTQQQNEQKKKLLDQYKNPSAKQQFLQSWLAQEILYRDALEQSLPEKPQVKMLLEDLTREVLSQQLMNKELADKINITETDLQTYYQANKEKFIEPASKEDPNSVERQKSFDKARQQVMTELLSRKRQDVQADFIQKMMDKYNVIIHTSELNKNESAEPEKQ